MLREVDEGVVGGCSSSLGNGASLAMARMMMGGCVVEEDDGCGGCDDDDD